MPNAHQDPSSASAPIIAISDRTGVSLREFMAIRSAPSERQQNVEQDRVLRFAAVGVVELLQTLASNERRSRGIEHDVLGEQRPVLYRRRDIGAQIAIDIALVAKN